MWIIEKLYVKYIGDTFGEVIHYEHITFIKPFPVYYKTLVTLNGKW